MASLDPTHSKVLCVDLDGTLIKTDSAYEAFFRLLKVAPRRIFGFFVALLTGRAAAKKFLSRFVDIRPEFLPYNQKVIDFINAQKSAGVRAILVTGSDEKIAQVISQHLGLFSEVMASDGKINLTSKRKAAKLNEKFGEKNYDYIGNSFADFAVWDHAHKKYAVSNSAAWSSVLRIKHPDAEILDASHSKVGDYLRAIRPYQWVKNLLVFIPIIVGHQILDPLSLFCSALAFVGFSCCASSGYLFNDLLDLEADREHESKRSRPLAAGLVDVRAALLLSPLLFTLGLALGFSISVKLGLAFFLYWILSLSYSVYFKRVLAFDIVLLASLYTLRILAGGYATDIRVSEWLLAFSVFTFLSLACVKRYSELYFSQKSRGKAYSASDMPLISQFGITSGFISVLVFSLYLSSKETSLLYSRPIYLWMACPLFLYWYSRLWLLTARGEVSEDPLVFALKDKLSYLVGLGCSILVLMAL